NIVALSPAAEPTTPTKPNIALNMLLSIFVGALLGIGFALMAEFANRRVRSPEGLAEAINLPVLACVVSTSPQITFYQMLRDFLSRRKVRQLASASAAIS
ncbi:MAG: chain length determinant protein EpsF, partial [Pseudomonadota bacterium]